MKSQVPEPLASMYVLLSWEVLQPLFSLQNVFLYDKKPKVCANVNCL